MNLVSSIVSPFYLLLALTLVEPDAARAQSGPPPGVVITESPDPQRAFIGTPAIAVLDDGTLVVAHDFFGKSDLTDTARVFGSTDGRSLTFEPSRGFVHFPGSQSKYTIRFDPVSRRYWSLVQKITNPYTGYLWENSPNHQRNVLMLTSSSDLATWTERSVVLRWNEGRMIPSQTKVGFQYVDWQFDGDDLIAVSRTSWGGRNYHDANYPTFHRVKGFRTLTAADESPDLADRVGDRAAQGTN